MRQRGCGRAPIGLFALLTVVGASSSAAEFPRLFLSQVPVVNRTGKPMSFEHGYTVVLHLSASADLAASLRRFGERFPGAAADKDAVRFRYDKYTPPTGAVAPLHRESTYVVDFPDPSFLPLKEAIVRAYGKSPTGKQLADFVFRYIEKKDMARPFDIASVVVRRKEGDCSEHAVLLAAVTRAFGVPSRVIHGLVFLTGGNEVAVYAHAWVEVWTAAGWAPLDATRPDAATAEPGRAYLPLFALTDESMTYAMAMFEPFQSTMPRSVDIE